MPDNKRSGAAHHGPAPEISATAKQLDLTNVESTATADIRPRTEPDPAVRRHNLEEGRRRRDEGITYAAANTPIGWADLVDDTTAVIRASCVARGCHCTPDVEITERDGSTYIRVQHDNGCPAIGGEVWS